MVSWSWKVPSITFGIAAIGAAITFALKFPAPFLTGPAMAVTLAGLAGVKTGALPQQLRDVVFVILGLTIGQGVTPEVFGAMRAWPVTLAALAASLFAIILITRAILVRYWSMDQTTAFLSSSPGHLSYVLGLTEGVKADLRMVSIVQSIRVLALTLLVPVAVALGGRIPDHAIQAPVETAPGPLLALFIAAGGAGYVLKRLRLLTAFLIGGMLVSMAAHVTGIVGGVMNSWLAAVAFVSLGALIGSRFSGISWLDLRRAFSVWRNGNSLGCGSGCRLCGGCAMDNRHGSCCHTDCPCSRWTGNHGGHVGNPRNRSNLRRHASRGAIADTDCHRSVFCAARSWQMNP